MIDKLYFCHILHLRSVRTHPYTSAASQNDMQNDKYDDTNSPQTLWIRNLRTVWIQNIENHMSHAKLCRKTTHATHKSRKSLQPSTEVAPFHCSVGIHNYVLIFRILYRKIPPNDSEWLLTFTSIKKNEKLKIWIELGSLDWMSKAAFTRTRYLHRFAWEADVTSLELLTQFNRLT